MKRLMIFAMILCLLCPVTVRAELVLELDPVEQDLLMERPIIQDQEVEPVKEKKNWLYLLLGVGVLGAAAGGGGGGGGRRRPPGVLGSECRCGKQGGDPILGLGRGLRPANRGRGIRHTLGPFGTHGDSTWLGGSGVSGPGSG